MTYQHLSQIERQLAFLWDNQEVALQATILIKPNSVQTATNGAIKSAYNIGGMPKTMINKL